MLTIDRFLICLPFTLAQECPLPNDWSNAKNFSDDRHDPGGKTMCGIIQREYDVWRKGHGLLVQDVRKIGKDEGEAIYRVCYWQPHCGSLAPGLDLQFFDESVNAGTSEAIRILQVALGIPEDGAWGPQTAVAAAWSFAPQHLPTYIEAFTARREAVYRQLKGFPYFGTDWLRRSAEIGMEALKMAAA
jgi:lysozyme family protein